MYFKEKPSLKMIYHPAAVYSKNKRQQFLIA